MEAVLGIVQSGVAFVVVLSILVYIHEYGHFWVARRCGVKVEAFSIGFGPELFGWYDKHGTRWKISALPLGGYVKMYGDADPASTPDEGVHRMTDEERGLAFFHKTLGQRAAIVAAGPIANFLLAFVILFGLFVFLGQKYTPTIIDGIIEGSAAESAGLQPGDEILAIGEREVDRFEAIQRTMLLWDGGSTTVTFIRDGAEMTLPITPKMVMVPTGFGGNETQTGRLGIMANGSRFEPVPVLEAPGAALVAGVNIVTDTFKAVGQMISGTRSAEDLGGPIRIAHFSGEAFGAGIYTALFFMALLSINLGIINLFPIPMLDGGHLAFYLYEWLAGKPASPQVQEFGYRIGMALVLTLMVAVFANDIFQLVG